ESCTAHSSTQGAETAVRRFCTAEIPEVGLQARHGSSSGRPAERAFRSVRVEPESYGELPTQPTEQVLKIAPAHSIVSNVTGRVSATTNEAVPALAGPR